MAKRNGFASGVILLGGGLDSGALLYWLRSHLRGKPSTWLHALWIEYGQKAALGELNAAMRMCERTGTPLHTVRIDLGDLSECALLRGRQRNARNHSRMNKLEARNIIFVGLAAMLAASRGLRCVYVGYHKEPDHAPFPDATADAREVMDILLSVACRPQISLVAPFEKLSREAILWRGLKLNPNLPAETFTCYESETDAECGQCAHCQRKARMLKRVKAQTGPQRALPESYGKRDLLRRRNQAQKQPSVRATAN